MITFKTLQALKKRQDHGMDYLRSTGTDEQAEAAILMKRWNQEGLDKWCAEQGIDPETGEPIEAAEVQISEIDES